MSEYTSSTYRVPRPVLTPEQIQQQRIQNAVNTAVAQSNTARQREIENLKNLQRLREQDFERKIANLDSTVQEAARRHKQQMQQQSNEFYKKLEQQDAENKEALATQRAETIAAVAATNQRIENIARNQQQQIDGIKDKFRLEDEKAKCLQEELQAALAYVQTLQYNKYKPGDLQRIADRVNGLNKLPATSVIGIVYPAIKDLNNLAKDIEQARVQYETKHTEAMQEAEKVLLTMNENRKNTCFTDGNNKILEDKNGNPVKVELDFWSEGEYSEIEQKLTELKTKVKNGLTAPNFTMKHLDDALTEINAFDERQNQIVVESIMKGVASEARAVQADAAIECLQKQFYYLIERGYDDKDQRKSYRVKMKNNNGNTIEVLISSKESDLTEMIVETHEESENYESDTTKLIRSKELNQALKDEGIEGLYSSETKCISEKESTISKIYDQEALRKSIQK